MADLAVHEPMETAPRDGRLIWLFDEDVGEFLMRWNPHATNGLIPDVEGFWEAEDGSFTWCDQKGGGPSGWRPYQRMDA